MYLQITHLYFKEDQNIILIILTDPMLLIDLSDLIYPFIEQIFMVPKEFETLKIGLH